MSKALPAIIPSISFDGIEGIKEVLDTSSYVSPDHIPSIRHDLSIYRMRVVFFNGYQLTVVKEVDWFEPLPPPLFEIALFNAKGEWVTELIEDESDVIIRCITVKEVLAYLHKTSKLEKTEDETRN